MKQKHTTRHQRQAARQTIEHKIQELEQRQAPRRAALALLNMRQAALLREQVVRSSVVRESGGAR